MALITALSLVASQPSFHDASAPSIEERFQLDASFIVARHVTWQIEEQKPHTFRDLALATYFGDRVPSPNDACRATSLPGVELRVVPDDPRLAAPVHEPLGCDPEGIDLLDACASGCTDGATVLAAYEHHEGFAAEAGNLFVVLEASAWAELTDGLQLVSAPRPGEDRHAAHVTTGRLAYAFDVGPGNPIVELNAVLHVSGEALQEPLDGLHGWIGVGFSSVDVKAGYGSIQTLTVGTLDPYAPDSVMGSANVEVDWLAQCRPGEDCDIPLTLEVRTPLTGPRAPSFDPQTRQDFWRWALEANLVALDGRALPPNALRIDGPSDPIDESNDGGPTPAPGASFSSMR